MNYAGVSTVTTIGLNVLPVTVEVDVDRRAIIYDIDIVGLGDTVVKESKKRVKSALKNSGFGVPQGRITVNLAPSDVKKEGSYLDLPIAVGMLQAAEVLNGDLGKYVFFGELGLDGTLRKVRGVLPILLSLSQGKNGAAVILPIENAREASAVRGLEVYAVRDLKDLVSFLNGYSKKTPIEFVQPDLEHAVSADISDVKGHDFAKRAAEIAAAGQHNISFRGSPGCGKTMLARRISGILPRMTMEEALETTMIYSIAGLLDDKGLISERPFRAPHHTASTTAIIGGGTDARPGEISLANNGVLFLDEFPEFRKDVIEALRQPIEDGTVTIARAKLTVRYPSRFMFVAAQNPCVCGWYGDNVHECTCSWNDIRRYNRKVSGPMEDRIDIFVDMPRLEFKEYASRTPSETSLQVRERVERARKRQLVRLSAFKLRSNSQMTHKLVQKMASLDSAGGKLLESAIEKMKLTGRSIDRVLKVARTIADLDDEENVLARHLAEALQYRKKTLEL